MEVRKTKKGSSMEKIVIPNPSWDSSLANIILDLEKLFLKIFLIKEIPSYK